MSLGYSGDYITIAGTTIKIESTDAAWYSYKDDTNFVCFISKSFFSFSFFHSTILS